MKYKYIIPAFLIVFIAGGLSTQAVFTEKTELIGKVDKQVKETKQIKEKGGREILEETITLEYDKDYYLKKEKRCEIYVEEYTKKLQAQKVECTEIKNNLKMFK